MVDRLSGTTLHREVAARLRHGSTTDDDPEGAPT